MRNDSAIERVWKTYVRSWTITTPEAKRAAFETSLSTDFVYTDPLVRTEGWEPLIAYMLAFSDRAPAGRFVTQQLLTCGDQSAARWDAQDTDGLVPPRGIGHAVYGSDGLLLRVTNFFETPA